MNKNKDNKREILLPLPIINKIQEQFEHLFLRDQPTWIKVTEIGERVIKRKPVMKDNIPHYIVTIEEYNFLSKVLSDITENII